MRFSSFVCFASRSFISSATNIAAVSPRTVKRRLQSDWTVCSFVPNWFSHIVRLVLLSRVSRPLIVACDIEFIALVKACGLMFKFIYNHITI